MNSNTLFIVGLGSTMVGCQHVEKKQSSALSQHTTQLQQSLTQLVKNVYKWNETQAKLDDFHPKEDPTSDLYVGLDVAKHQQRLTELKDSGFFSSVFLEQYHAQAIQMHTDLLEGRAEWPVGYQSPFSDGSDIWCRCQDAPERYWEKIQIVDMRPEGDTVRILWSLGDNFTYMMRAEQTDSGMKIRYMEGLDSTNAPVSSAY
ncbi:MAG: hypothetical protein VX278_15730 [Myxococcota bacterium]|nr:hypothetical protein [Myxococcota bacterium]